MTYHYTLIFQYNKNIDLLYQDFYYLFQKKCDSLIFIFRHHTCNYRKNFQEFLIFRKLSDLPPEKITMTNNLDTYFSIQLK